MLLKQIKTNVKPPYKPIPNKVVKVNDSQLTVARDGKENKRKVKKIPERPVHLMKELPTVKAAGLRLR